MTNLLNLEREAVGVESEVKAWDTVAISFPLDIRQLHSREEGK